MNYIEEMNIENKIVAWWLLHYEEKRKEYEQKVNGIIDGSIHSSIVIVGAVQPEVRDPTGGKAVKIIDELKEIREWLELIEEVEEKLPFKLRTFLKLRREAEERNKEKRDKGRPSWIPYVQRRFAEEMAKHYKKREEDVWINAATTFIEWWHKIVDYAARLAAKRGLI